MKPKVNAKVNHPALVSLIRETIRLRHRLAANEEIQAVRTDPTAVAAIRRRHRLAGDEEIRTLTEAAMRRANDCLGSWNPTTIEEVIAICALSRRELWEWTGEWDRHVRFWTELDEEQVGTRFEGTNHASMKNFADYPGVAFDLLPLPAKLMPETPEGPDKVCSRGHGYSTKGAPKWLGGRCPECRAASKLAHRRQKLLETVAA